MVKRASVHALDLVRIVRDERGIDIPDTDLPLNLNKNTVALKEKLVEHLKKNLGPSSVEAAAEALAIAGDYMGW